ncbi:hypothetical protein EIP86_011610 [Pleurotus ostreatoroseus]|nr:hypothetical protein EIP86_011610 [Pleurotus ostreatoroseus]
MSLQRVGGASDGGIDLQGWWWLPTSVGEPHSDNPADNRRMRVLAQCKAEKRKIGPAYLREMEGVLHRYSVGAPQALSSSTEQATPSQSPYPIVGLFLSSSPFTKQAMLRVHSSPFPFCLLHLPEPEEIEANEDEAEQTNLGSIILNPTLAAGVLRGEIEARLEHPSRPGELARPGLWWKERRIRSWVPEQLTVEIPNDSIDIVYDNSAENKVQ